MISDPFVRTVNVISKPIINRKQKLILRVTDKIIEIRKLFDPVGINRVRILK